MTAPYQIVIVIIIISVQAIPLSVLKEHKSVLLLEGIICNKDFRVPNGNKKGCHVPPFQTACHYFFHNMSCVLWGSIQ